MDQVSTITIARQAVKIAQYEELIELLKAELIKLQPAPADEEGADIEIEGDLDLPNEPTQEGPDG